jgi:hypothetical protein
LFNSNKNSLPNTLADQRPANAWENSQVDFWEPKIAALITNYYVCSAAELKATAKREFVDRDDERFSESF